jgi:hypothetical protein
LIRLTLFSKLFFISVCTVDPSALDLMSLALYGNGHCWAKLTTLGPLTIFLETLFEDSEREIGGEVHEM